MHFHLDMYVLAIWNNQGLNIANYFEGCDLSTDVCFGLKSRSG